MKQQFNVYLDPDLVRRTKFRALDEQLSLSDFVARALERTLGQPGGSKMESTKSEAGWDGGLVVQPMVHVENLAQNIAFYEALGGKLVFGSRDGDWALLRFGETWLSLLARPPSEDNPEPVELQFVCGGALEAVAARMAQDVPGSVARGVADEAFGRMLQLRTADGLLVKILELDRTLIA